MSTAKIINQVTQIQQKKFKYYNPWKS